MKLKKIRFIFLIFVVATCIYSLCIAPNQLEVTMFSRSYYGATEKLRLAHITDLHTRGLGALEQKMIASLNTQKPDIIVITGDISTPDGTNQGYEEVLKELRAPMGVYFIPGNWEYWNPIKGLRDILKKYNITDLTNKRYRLGTRLELIGFDDIEGLPKKELMDSLSDDVVYIALFHSPVFFKKIARKVQLSLAGHSHGGQVRLPFIGALWTPSGTGEFVSGWFKDDNKEMYVSRGLGNSILPLRFFCSPELTYIDINY